MNLLNMLHIWQKYIQKTSYCRCRWT